jgi:hypothetical protein
MRSAGPDGALPGPVAEQQRCVPVLLDWQCTLVETGGLAWYLSGLRVYPSSLRLRARWLLRAGACATEPRGFGGDRAPRPGADLAEAAAEVLRGPLLGVQYEDGRAAALGLHGRYQVTSPEGAELPTFELGSASATDREEAAELNLFGLPERGSITLHWSWLDLGVPESSLVLDGDTLREAASRSLVLWEEREETASSAELS